MWYTRAYLWGPLALQDLGKMAWRKEYLTWLMLTRLNEMTTGNGFVYE